MITRACIDRALPSLLPVQRARGDEDPDEDLADEEETGLGRRAPARMTLPLSTPAQLRARHPASAACRRRVRQARREIAGIVEGLDPRLLVIVGPCSIHDASAAVEYGRRLASLQERVREALCLVMRVYLEKPRTTVGWKGLISDPRLDGSVDVEAGLHLARALLTELTGLGVAAATEFLDPLVPAYLGDLVSWAAIGARTSESQLHRQLASALGTPVGFKNRTDGNCEVAVDAIVAARSPHRFLGLDHDGRAALVQGAGNLHGHLILRGGGDCPNYDAPSVSRAARLLERAGLSPRVMVDCSHGNSGRDHRRQPLVLAEVLDQLARGSRHLLGVMLESNLEAGRQDAGPGPAELAYGVSITDACIDWDTTERVLLEAAQVVAR